MKSNHSDLNLNVDEDRSKNRNIDKKHTHRRLVLKALQLLLQVKKPLLQTFRIIQQNAGTSENILKLHYLKKPVCFRSASICRFKILPSFSRHCLPLLLAEPNKDLNTRI